MPKEPENIVYILLRDIRTKRDEYFTQLEAVETRVRHVESQLDDLRMAVTYALGQSPKLNSSRPDRARASTISSRNRKSL